MGSAYFKEILSCRRKPFAWPSLRAVTLRTFSLPESQCFPSVGCFFDSGSLWKTHFCLLVNIFFFFTETGFSVHITRSTKNYIWFALLRHQKLMTNPSSSLEHSIWFAAILNSIQINIHVRFLIETNFKQCKVNIYWKISLYLLNDPCVCA